MKDDFDKCVSHCRLSCRSTITAFTFGHSPKALKSQPGALLRKSHHLSEVSVFLRETVRMTKVTLFLPLTPQLSEQEKAPTMEK